MLKKLASGLVALVLASGSGVFSDIVLSDAEKQQAASEKREQLKKERESKKGGK